MVRRRSAESWRRLEEETSSLGRIMGSCSSWEDESWIEMEECGVTSSSRRLSSWSERRPRRRKVTAEFKLKRDDALSPSARVKGLEPEWQSPNVLEVVKRRASVLHAD